MGGKPTTARQTNKQFTEAVSEQFIKSINSYTQNLDQFSNSYSFIEIINNGDMKCGGALAAYQATSTKLQAIMSMTIDQRNELKSKMASDVTNAASNSTNQIAQGFTMFMPKQTSDNNNDSVIKVRQKISNIVDNKIFSSLRQGATDLKSIIFINNGRLEATGDCIFSQETIIDNMARSTADAVVVAISEIAQEQIVKATATNTTTQKQDGNLFLWIFFGIVVVAMIIGAVVYMIKTGGGKKKAPAMDFDDFEPPEPRPRRRSVQQDSYVPVQQQVQQVQQIQPVQQVQQVQQIQPVQQVQQVQQVQPAHESAGLVGSVLNSMTTIATDPNVQGAVRQMMAQRGGGSYHPSRRSYVNKHVGRNRRDSWSSSASSTPSSFFSLQG